MPPDLPVTQVLVRVPETREKAERFHFVQA
jgi:hypothetical protein